MAGAAHPAVPASTRPSTTAVIPAVDVTRSGQVEVAPAALGLDQHRPTHDEHGQADGDVDEHHPAPRRPLGEQAAGDQAGGPSGGGDGGEQPDSPHPGRPVGEEGGQQGQGGRRGQGAAHPLQGPGGQQHPAAGGEAAGERAQGEQGDAGHERPAPAEQVARSGTEQQQAAEGEHVGVQHPRQRRVREAEAALDMGQGHVHDGGVEHHHQLGGEDDPEDYGGMAAPPAGHSPEICDLDH